MSQSRKYRGMKTQALVARWFRAHGWPFAESAGSGRNGADLTGTPDIAVEVKARRELRPVEWVRQAQAAADGRLPFVVFRPDGMGETTIHEWPCLIRLDALTALLHEAGYGDPMQPAPDMATPHAPGQTSIDDHLEETR